MTQWWKNFRILKQRNSSASSSFYLPERGSRWKLMLLMLVTMWGTNEQSGVKKKRGRLAITFLQSSSFEVAGLQCRCLPARGLRSVRRHFISSTAAALDPSLPWLLGERGASWKVWWQLLSCLSVLMRGWGGGSGGGRGRWRQEHWWFGWTWRDRRLKPAQLAREASPNQDKNVLLQQQDEEVQHPSALFFPLWQ